MTTLLVIGSDPARIPGYDPAPVPATPERGRDGAAGTGTTEVLVGPDDGLPRVTAAPPARGGGLRTPRSARSCSSGWRTGCTGTRPAR
ncbi:hypothetical protein [Pseudonocardia alni]|uniref:hypothetical protein n=1 Tax=Pseudonocardia alni TaxID=33907 RepID=UPI00279D7648|nr:hypothetical protein PaSha_26555 [Pseudonocardia alni]